MSDVTTRLESVIAKHKSGQVDDAEVVYRQILADHPTHAGAHHMLGVAHLQKNRPEDALARIRRAITIDPTDQRYHNNLGHCLMLLKKPGEAVPAFEAALECDANFNLARFNLGTAFMELGQLGDAEREFRAILAKEPNDTDALMNLGAALLEQWRPAEALDCFQTLNKRHPNNPTILFNLAIARQQGSDLEGARQALETAMRLKPDWAEADAHLAMLEHAEAPGPGTLDAMEELLRNPEVTGYTRTLLLFRLGEAHDRADGFDRAFGFFAEANEATRGPAHNFRKDQDLMNRIKAKFDRSFFEIKKKSGDESPGLVFVVGMPRAGKTLVEQILASHPRVYGAGETSTVRDLIDDLPRLLGTTTSFPECLDALTPAKARDLGDRCVAALGGSAPQGAGYVVDTMPGNSYYLGFIRLILPRARIIHCLRDPLDTCLYCYFRNFKKVPYASDLTQLGNYFVIRQRLMDHWRAILPNPPLEVRYESVVDDPAAESRRIFDYCGLNWNDAFAEDADAFPIPFNTTEIGRARQYRQHLAPLIRILDSAGIA